MEINALTSDKIQGTTEYSMLSSSNTDDVEIVSKVSMNEIEIKSNSNRQFTEKELEKSINKLNKFLEDDKAHAEYEFHDTFNNTLMVKIIDDTTKQIILEVPPKKILDMVASMCRQFGIIDKEA